ncbi:hypothetical protein E1262_25105 [Jiangella aurantiaca]|uniref:Uncharacterized protein n=1 Tax=Jiangella aurantiaca TaxID=2530373 RepID=A0A4R5A788_9ACTN|nr:hypothetical protein [Jiangella aurantiaca]TDD65462.1 hypothetical protein E1262_25105 [Jiangella aurantiaca]
MTDPTHKAVSDPEEHADQPGQTLVTRDHEVIRRWAESRGAVPAGTADVPGTTVSPGTLQLALPGSGAASDEVSWDRWFESFDRYDLRFRYREAEADGTTSTFWELDASGREEG